MNSGTSQIKSDDRAQDDEELEDRTNAEEADGDGKPFDPYDASLS